jgi:hypothetical protein
LLRFLIVAYVRKPFLAKIREVSYPIPVELPVTTATLWLAGGGGGEGGEGGGEEEGGGGGEGGGGEEAIYILLIYRYTVLHKSVSDSLAT